MDAAIILMANSIFLLLIVIVMFIILSANKSIRIRNAIIHKSDLKRIKDEVNEKDFI